MKIDKEKENLFFKSRKIIRINESELDKPIYRVFPKKWLLETLKESENALVKPSMWDDPFENFVFSSTAKTNTGELIGFDTIRDNFYGQCWTFSTEETDALWRIYSPSKDGFRVKSTVRKLFDQFYDPKHKWAMIAFYVGKILYQTEVEIREYFENPDNLHEMIFDTSGNGQVETLLIKRKEFEHENELRFIFYCHQDWYDTKQLTYKFPIDINLHFEELLADPRMDDNEFLKISDEIRKLGYNNTVEKSTLYQIPNLNLTLKI